MDITATTVIGSDERLNRTARYVARATGQLRTPNEQIAKAELYLGRAVAAHMLGRDEEAAECMNAAEMWAVAALRAHPDYAGSDEHDRHWAEKRVADDPAVWDEPVSDGEWA